MAVEDTDRIDLEVPYSNDHVRLIINDTLPWTADEALSFHPWSDEETMSFHLDVIERKIDHYIAVVTSEAFQLRHPKTTLGNVRIVLRFRHMPIPSAGGFMMLIEKRVENESIEFVYGYGGDEM